MEFLFVYGTLRQAHQNPMARVLEHEARYVGQGHIRGVLYDLGEYPGAVCIEEGNQRVYGDLYGIPDRSNLLAIMDDYEGIAQPHSSYNEYRRVTTNVVIMPDKKILKAWVYEYIGNSANLPKIEGGDYLQFMKNKMG